MIPSVPFYLIRHGESEANVLNLVAGGAVDSPLTDIGRAQADALSAYMVDHLPVRPRHLFHSPQIRAKETAQRVNAKLNLAMTEIDDLREHMMGDWEGKDWTVIRPHIMADERAPNGESRTDFSKRIKRVLDEILAIDPETPPLIVAHGGTFHAIGKLYEWKFGAMQNCHLHLFSPDGTAQSIPWELFQFDISNDQLIQQRSPFCPKFK